MECASGYDWARVRFESDNAQLIIDHVDFTVSYICRFMNCFLCVESIMFLALSFAICCDQS